MLPVKKTVLGIEVFIGSGEKYIGIGTANSSYIMLLNIKWSIYR